MEISTLHIVIGGICTVAGVAIPVLAYAIYSGKAFGKMEEVVVRARLDIINNTSDIDKLGSKVDENREQTFDEFVSRRDCDAIVKQWETLFSAALDKRDMVDVQNGKDHSRISEEVADSKKEAKESMVSVFEKLDKISDSLHDIQIENEKK